MKHGSGQRTRQRRKNEATERECVTFSNLLLGPCFIRGKKLWSAISVRRFFFFSNSLSPVLIRVQSVFHLWQKIFSEATSLDYRMSQIVLGRRSDERHLGDESRIKVRGFLTALLQGAGLQFCELPSRK